jgi:hypothetical protein
MKIRKLFLMAFAGMVMASCSEKDQVSEIVANETVEGQMTWITFSLRMASENMTRAFEEGQIAGTDNENAVKQAKLFIFSSDGICDDYVEVADLLNNTGMTNGEDKGDTGIDKIFDQPKNNAAQVKAGEGKTIAIILNNTTEFMDQIKAVLGADLDHTSVKNLRYETLLKIVARTTHYSSKVAGEVGDNTPGFDENRNTTTAIMETEGNTMVMTGILRNVKINAGVSREQAVNAVESEDLDHNHFKIYVDRNAAKAILKLKGASSQVDNLDVLPESQVWCGNNLTATKIGNIAGTRFKINNNSRQAYWFIEPGRKDEKGVYPTPFYEAFCAANGTYTPENVKFGAEAPVAGKDHPASANIPTFGSFVPVTDTRWYDMVGADYSTGADAASSEWKAVTTDNFDNGRAIVQAAPVAYMPENTHALNGAVLGNVTYVDLYAQFNPEAIVTGYTTPTPALRRSGQFVTGTTLGSEGQISLWCYNYNVAFAAHSGNYVDMVRSCDNSEKFTTGVYKDQTKGNGSLVKPVFETASADFQNDILMLICKYVNDNSGVGADIQSGQISYKKNIEEAKTAPTAEPVGPSSVGKQQFYFYLTQSVNKYGTPMYGQWDIHIVRWAVPYSNGLYVEDQTTDLAPLKIGFFRVNAAGKYDTYYRINIFDEAYGTRHPMHYSVMRNNYYQVDVNSVKGIGQNIDWNNDRPQDGIQPAYEENTYMQTTIKIYQWVRKSMSDVVIGI